MDGERKTYSDLYKEYELKHNYNNKHDFAHFVTVLAKLDHHRTFIRPKIKWWSENGFDIKTIGLK